MSPFNFCLFLFLVTIKGCYSFIIHKQQVVGFGNKKKQNNIALPFSKTSSQNAARKIVIVSPPGNIGEISAIESALRGASVYWFVVTSSTYGKNVKFSQDTWQSIKRNGGSIEIAGMTYKPQTEKVILQWCGNDIDSLICTLDGIDEKDENIQDWENSINVVVQEANSGLKKDGKKIVLSPLNSILYNEDTNLIPTFLKKPIPKSLIDAVSENNSNICVIRYGQLFGSPETSDDASILVGGPKRDPTIRDQYIMRSVRFEPFLETKFKDLGVLEKQTRSSRLSLGEAAALISIDQVPTRKNEYQDFILTSLRGAEKLSLEEYQTEFQKLCQEKASSELFNFQYSNVPSIKRLGDWIERKWAPSILRTYDIAGIRVGGRPVYTTRPSDDTVEIVFQTLNEQSQSITVGKMIISLTNTGIKAERQVLEQNYLNNNLFGGEDILVRSLAEASAQAIEKGLAIKAKLSKQEVPQKEILTETPVLQETLPTAAQPTITRDQQQPERKSVRPRRSSKRSSRNRRKRNASKSNNDSS